MSVIKPLGIGECYDECVVSEDGTVEVTQHGYAGSECKNASRNLEQRLGRVIDRRDIGGEDGGNQYQPTGG